MNFLAELRRRNVIRMAGLYLVGAWLLVQVAETLLPIFDTPGWVLKALVVLLAIGFLPALVFSWVFELTPEGLKRESEIDPSRSIVDHTARRLDVAVIALLLLAIGLFAYGRLHPVDAPPSAAGAAAAGDDAGAAANSIAVLPFVNMSPDAEQEYFSDGISEEILNVLARTPALQVAARTSSFSFKGSNQEVPEIARTLNVRLVLEGSVRKQGNRVRITAQLIDAPSGYHLWSQTFDRDLDDIFAIQDEIARAVADALQVKLSADTPAAASGVGTANLEAYDLYLRGLALWQLREEQSLWEAIALFERAAAADSGFARAHAGQALSYVVIADYSARMAPADAHRRARDHAERALGLDAGLPEPYVVLAQLASMERRRAASQALFQRAIALSPSFATAHQWRGTALMGAGDVAAAVASTERAVALDPRSRVVANNHSWVLLSIGDYEGSIRACEATLDYAPEYPGCHDNLWFAHALNGNLAGARRHLLRLAELTKPGSRALAEQVLAGLEGHGDRATLARRLAAFPPLSYIDPGSENLLFGATIPALLLLLGEPELALGYLESLVADDPTNATEWGVMLPALDPLRCDPRFVAIIARIDSVDPHHAAACADNR